MFEPGLLYRLPFYIAFGLCCEFLFTAMMDWISPSFLKSWNVFGKEEAKERPSWKYPGRDPRLMGYSFLWMLPIYALLIFMEPLSFYLKPLPWFIRGVIYVFLLWIVEYLSGWLIRRITGRIPWDYSLARFHLHGVIRFDFFPFWFVFMLVAEWWSGKLIVLTPALQSVF